MEEFAPILMDDALPEDPAKVRQMGQMFLESLLRFWAESSGRPVYPAGYRPEPAAFGPDEPPLAGRPLAEILADLQASLWPGLVTVSSPRYLGMMNPSPALVAVFAEALAAAYNQNCSLWHQSPAATEMENTVIRWLTRLTGLDGPGAGGMLVSGGSMANITALKLARDRGAGPGVRERGLWDQRERLAVYVSEEAHYSFEKGMDALGLGTAALRRVPVDDGYRIRLPELRRQIEADLRQGSRPVCLVGIAGTTNTGSIDPLAGLAAMAREYGAWFHVDAAYGGAALLPPENTGRFAGIELADSVTLDPHKWFFIPFEGAAILVRDRARLRDSFTTQPHYYMEQAEADAGRLNFFEHGFQGSRGFKALKIWCAFQFLGLEYYRQVIRRNLGFARRLFEILSGEPGFEVFHRPQLGLLCFRFHPEGTDDPELLNALNRNLHQRIEREGRFWISITRLGGGQVTLRANFMNYRTRPEDVEEFGRVLLSLRSEVHL